MGDFAKKALTKKPVIVALFALLVMLICFFKGFSKFLIIGSGLLVVAMYIVLTVLLRKKRQ